MRTTARLRQTQPRGATRQRLPLEEEEEVEEVGTIGARQRAVLMVLVDAVAVAVAQPQGVLAAQAPQAPMPAALRAVAGRPIKRGSSRYLAAVFSACPSPS